MRGVRRLAVFVALALALPGCGLVQALEQKDRTVSTEKRDEELRDYCGSDTNSPDRAAEALISGLCMPGD